MNTLDTIKKILAEQLDIEEDAITETTALEDLGADSLDIVEAIMSIEEEFKIEVDDGAIETLKTIGDIAEYISKK